MTVVKVNKQPAPISPIQRLINTYAGYVQSPAQLRASARQAVQDSIAATNQQLQRQATRAQGFATALATATRPDPEQIGGFYREAADRLRGYGTGLTGAVAADQQNAADSAREAVQRITGGLGTSSGYDPAALRNAAQMSSVVIPGSTLESQAAAAMARAQYGRAASAANIGNIAQQYLQKQADLQATVPSLIRQETASEQQNARQDIATLISALGLQNTITGTTAGLTGKVPGTNTPTAGRWVNPSTGVVENIPSGFTVKIVKGVPRLVKVAGASGTSGVLTPARIQTMVTNANKSAVKIVESPNSPYVTVTNPKQVQYGGAVPVYKPRLSYAAAKLKLLQYYPVPVRKTPAAQRAVADILASHGYKR